MVGYTNLDAAKVQELCGRIFESYGFDCEAAAFISDVLLRADRYGIESHGVQRMIRYHNAMKDGEVDPSARPEIVHESPVSATVDAHQAMGQLAGRFGMELAIQKAKTSGIGMVAVRNSNHYGIAGYYSKMACDADLMGVCMTNSEAIMVPTFGKKAMLGTNPIAVAMPADPTPFLFDAATTVVPRGKLEVFAKRESPLPEGWVLDEMGGDTTDANLVLHNIIHKLGGGIAPLGGTGEATSGYKGYGFGMVCELFTSILSGGLTSPHCVTKDHNLISHGFWAIDYGIFGDKEEIKRHFSGFLQDVREAPKAEGQERIYIQGEKELESFLRSEKAGIPLNAKTMGELREIAREAGFDAEPYLVEVS